MDVVYAVRRGNVNDELRYSLRSLVNLPHDRVWIVGHLPPWVVGVGHLPTVQSVDKWSNARANWQRAVNSPDVSDPFIYMNDDFYVMAPVGSVPLLHRGELDDVAEQTTAASYAAAHRRTAALLRAEGSPTLCYDLHAPIVVDKAGFGRALDATAHDPRLLLRSVYGNRQPDPGEWRAEDVKVRGDEIVAGPFVSTSDATFDRSVMGRRIRATFPDPSPYEFVPARRAVLA